MHLTAILGAAALAGSSLAFSDSTPWVLFSTSPIAASAGQIQTSSAVVADTKQFLSSCPTDVYVVATQPGLNAADFASDDSQAMTSLHLAATKDARVKGRYIVSEVLGQLPDYDMAAFVRSACEKRGKSVKIMEAKLPELSEGARRASLQSNDKIISDYFTKLEKEQSFTVMLLSPPGEPLYEPDFDYLVQVNSRRAIDRADNSPPSTHESTAPLFETYQFFTPAIFMGLLVSIFLLGLVSVGIRAISSLEVSYGAFEKEMGPAAHKK